MASLLIVHHTPSPSLHTMLDAVLSGTSADGITGVEIVAKPALSATASDVLAADGYVLGTTANLGYMSGALKHFFDCVYYPCLDATARRPYGVFVHGDSDVTGATTAIAKIVTGLAWSRASDDVCVTGRPSAGDIDACWNLGATLAATVMDE